MKYSRLIVLLIVFCATLSMNAQNIGQIKQPTPVTSVEDDDEDDVVTAPKNAKQFKKSEEDKATMRALLGYLDEADMKSVTSFQIQTGVSNIYGEFARLRINLGRRGKSGESFVLYGGLGHEWLFTPKNPDFIKENGVAQKTLEWHAGLGAQTVGKNFTLSSLMDFSETALVQYYSLNVQLEFAYYFLNKRLGVFGSAGVGLGNWHFDENDEEASKEKVNFVFSAGLTLRLF